MSFSKLTYKQGCIYLLIGFFLFLLLAWNFSFSKTFSTYAQLQNSEKELARAKNASAEISGLEEKHAKLEQLIGKNTDQNKGVQERILEKLNTYCKSQGTLLRDFPETHYFNTHQYEISTNIALIEGSFVKLLQLLHLIETKYMLGKLVSVRFYSKKDMRTKITHLFMVLYIQNIKE